MEDAGNSTVPPPVPQADGNPDPTSYDDDDELLFLRLADVNNGPIQSELDAAIHGAKILGASAEEATAPPLMQRPKSSGIDMTGFSFPKPQQRKKSFSTRSSDKKQTAVLELDHQRDMGKLGSRGDEPSIDLSGVRTGVGRRPSSPLLNESHRCPDREHLSAKKEEAQRRSGDQMSTDYQNHSHDSNQVQMIPENEDLEAQDSTNSRIGNGGKHSRSSIPRGQRVNPDLAAPVHSDEAVPEDLYSRSSFRVTKRRTGNSRAHAPKQMPLGALGSNSHLTEDDLFQLLIGRIKQREENDIAATHARAKLEADVSELKKENKSLKDQVEVFGVQLQKRTLESRNYKAHISNWKERVGKFKKVLNGLGGDYQELCGESKHLKATAASLDKERKELAASLEIIKRDVSQASSAICEKRNHLSECQPIVGSLQSSLKSSEDKVESARIRLADERKRAAVLESYIQNHSIIQGKQVEVVRNDQLEMMDKMKFGFELIGKQWEFSQSNIHSGLKPMLDECLASIRSLGEKSSVDRVEIQQSTSTIQGLMSQMDSIALQLTKDIGSNSELNSQLVKELNERVEMIVDSVGGNSSMFKQLALSQDMCGILIVNLESVAPKLGHLTASIGKLGEKETELVQQLDEVADRVSEAKALEKAPLDSATQPANDQLQLQLEEASAQLSIVQASLEAKEMENETRRHELAEATAQTQTAENRAAQLEFEVASLQKNVQAIELKVREELNRASVVSRDHMRAKFEQQLHNAMKEKLELEKDSERMKKQLACIQQSLVESRTSYKEHKNEIDSLLSAKEEQIQSLQASQTDYKTKLAARDAEIKQYKNLEVSRASHQKLLEQQIDEAKEAVSRMEKEASLREEGQGDLSRELQTQFESLKKNFQQKDEECLSVQKELSAANSTVSSLQSGKEKAKGKIHSLLRRVQDSERWMKMIKETLEKLGMNMADESFAEAWNKVEELLQARSLKSGARYPCGSPKGPSVNYDTNNFRNVPTALTPRKNGGGSPEEVFQTTEVIYRSQSIQRGACSPSGSQRAYQSGIGEMRTVPDPQSTANIVRFSSFQNQSSPARSLCQNDDLNEFVDIFMLTPDNKGSLAQSTPNGKSQRETLEKAAEQLDIAKNNSEHADEVLGQAEATAEKVIDTNGGTKRKAVTFEAEISADETGNEVPHPRHNVQENKAEGLVSERATGRLNQRTYGKSQQAPSRKRSYQDHSRRAESGESDLLPRSPGDQHKKARASGNSRPERKTRRASEYFETRASTTSLASGSSRRSPTNGRKLSGRGQRQGRRSRGERYNARFSEETGSIH